MSQSHQLYRLQQIDNEIREKKQRLRQVLQGQKVDEALKKARQRKEETEEKLWDLRTRQKDLELELGKVNAKAERSEDRLYSGEVTNPKELEDLQREIASLGRRRDVLEEEILELMLQVEDAQAEDEAAGEELEELESAWNQRRERLAEEQEELAQDLNALLERREKQARRVDGEHMEAYKSVIAGRQDGVGVAALKNDMCQACGVRTSGNKARAARAGELVYCGGCDRILVRV